MYLGDFADGISRTDSRGEARVLVYSGALGCPAATPPPMASPGPISRQPLPEVARMQRVKGVKGLPYRRAVDLTNLSDGLPGRPPTRGKVSHVRLGDRSPAPQHTLPRRLAVYGCPTNPRRLGAFLLAPRTGEA